MHAALQRYFDTPVELGQALTAQIAAEHHLASWLMIFPMLQ